jgi:tetratricopeptide (TPR) repeat protein
MGINRPGCLALDVPSEFCQIRRPEYPTRAIRANFLVGWGTDMATITAPTASPDPTGTPTLRQLWQAPVFIAGLAALLTAWLARPAAGVLPDRQLDDDLNAARELLSRPDGDVRAAVEAARSALQHAEAFPDRLAEAHFLLGTGYMRLGDKTVAADAKLAGENWRLAREHLATAEHLGVPQEERGRLFYRLGKVGFLLKDNPDRVVERLAAGVDQADDRVEGFSLLTQAYLNLSPPNYKEALKANERLRQEVPRVDETVLAPAKLLGGELLLKMGRPEQARKVLEKINAQAPPEVLTQARLLRARTYQDEEKWKEASELWKAVLEDPRAQVPEPGRILYNLGVCHRGLDEPKEAAAVWEECLKRGRGDEAPAAALALAELRLREAADDKGLEQTLQLLKRAVDRVQAPDDWKNTLLEAPRAREAFERMAAAYRQAGRFDLAVQLTSIYDRIALPARAAALRAEVQTDWAKEHQELAKAATEPLARQQEENAARECLRQAGAALAEAAGRAATPAEQADYLWQSAGACQRGGDYETSAKLLSRFLERYPRSEHQAEGWYLLAEACRHLNDTEAALRAYSKCIEFLHSPFAFRARYHLALDAIEHMQIDRAEAILEDNLKQLRYEPDPEAKEKSLFTMGDLQYQRKQYKLVVQYLEEALGQFPANPEATRAHYQLADAYRQLASRECESYLIRGGLSEEAHKLFTQEQQRRYLKAAEEFQELAQFLDKPESNGHLQPDVALRVPFLAAECYLNSGQYKVALAKYDALAQRYRGRPPSVYALEGAARTCASANDFAAMRQRLALLRAALPSLPEAERPAWVEWAAKCERPVDLPVGEPQLGMPTP